MRSLLGALFITFGLLVSSALAQVSGSVETIGFDGEYRPGCWTPMVVRLSANGAPTGFYELRIWQHDLDGDLPYFSTRVSLTNTAAEQPFWTYFIPEPIHEGLTTEGSSRAELEQRLRITVHDASGRELAQLPLGPNARMHGIEPPVANSVVRATRLVLLVGAGAAPALGDYDPGRILGIKEDLAAVKITPDRLPENARGYDGVDAIVWLEGDPLVLSASGGLRFDALREYVRRGGHLVLNTPPQWQQLLGFDDMLPVDITGTELNARQSPVRDITGRVPYPTGLKGIAADSPWERYRVSQQIAVATPRPGSVVDEYADRVADPIAPGDRTPWLVRRPYGFGCVSWVAQDLGSRELLDRANWGWPAVWEEVLGALPNAPTQTTPVVDGKQIDKRRFLASGIRDLGFTVLDAMNLSGRAATLVGITVLFFIAYWLVAGPGAFFWLKFKGKAAASWFIFGAVALVATAATLGLVKLILRGKPELKHISLVRVDGDRAKPADVVSGIGMYVPRDGAQRIEIPATPAATAPPSLTPFPIHPVLHHRREGDKYLFAAPREYRVSVASDESARSAVADVPFRTTMKRLEADWTGGIDDRIEGNAVLRPSSGNVGYIGGILRNLTSHDLRNIYIAFRHEQPGGKPFDWLLYVPQWKAGDDLDLAAAFNPPTGKMPIDITVDRDKRIGPNPTFPVRGFFTQWMDLLSASVQPSVMDTAVTDLDTPVPVSVPLLSFFNRFPIVANDLVGDGRLTRAELHRSGLRDWDMSNALMAGRLVIVAQADDTALPVPLTVAGEPVNGGGRTIYQFSLPLAPIPDTPTTKPATTRPAAQ